MDFLRRLETERPVVFWVALALVFCAAFQLLVFLAGVVLGPFGLPWWAPVAAVLVALVVAARRQQGRR